MDEDTVRKTLVHLTNSPSPDGTYSLASGAEPSILLSEVVFASCAYLLGVFLQVKG